MIKLITFDLDNTLWDVDPVILRANKTLVAWLEDHFPEVIEIYNPETFSEVKKAIAQTQPDKLKLPTYLRRSLLTHCFEQIGLTGAYLEDAVDASFRVFHHARNEIEFYPTTLPLLSKLRKDFKLIALSNGNADIGLVGLGDYFDAQFSADSTGKPKPDPTMFREALIYANVRPEEAIHIGDHQIEDIEAARGEGFRTIWFNQHQADRHCIPDGEAACLSDIPHIIREL